jgi:hypothetical protein
MLRSVRDGKAEWTDVAAKLTKYKFVKPPPRPVPSTTDPNWWSDVDAYDPSDTANSWEEFEAAADGGLITQAQFRQVYEACHGPIPPFVSANGPTVEFGDSDELDDDPTATPSTTKPIGRVTIDATDPLGSLCGLAVLAQSLGTPVSDEDLLAAINRENIIDPAALDTVKAAMAVARER